METTQGLLDVLDNLGNTLAATVNHQDAEIDQLLSIKQNAWLLRNTAGCLRNFTAETLSKFLPFSGQMRSERLPEQVRLIARIPLVSKFVGLPFRGHEFRNAYRGVRCSTA